ncbi:hypothetical protein GOV14_04190 [Candidatus Pacearchaeota archaeon]|nr:hypothetical protein [Candidatus Pacearchaeota archaeon]
MVISEETRAVLRDFEALDKIEKVSDWLIALYVWAGIEAKCEIPRGGGLIMGPNHKKDSRFTLRKKDRRTQNRIQGHTNPLPLPRTHDKQRLTASIIYPGGLDEV